MERPKITCLTPSIRREMLGIVQKCLNRQTFKAFEWLVGSPEDYGFGTFIKEPDKREGDFYNLNKCWNSLFKQAKGELIVNIVDGLWFPPDTLEHLWNHYVVNPKSCISLVGNQYSNIVNDKPENMVWKDPRIRSDFGSMYEVNELEMELCIASFPRQAIVDIGGFEVEFDKGCAVGEKEAMLRMYKAGYKLFLDQALEYRAIKHDRIGGSEAWDKGYEIACQLFDRYRREIEAGTRMRLDFISE